MLNDENIIGNMNSKEHSEEPSTSMPYDDWMEESIDQFLRSIEYLEDTLNCTPSPQSNEVKGILDHEEIKDSYGQ